MSCSDMPLGTALCRCLCRGAYGKGLKKSIVSTLAPSRTSLCFKPERQASRSSPQSSSLLHHGPEGRRRLGGDELSSWRRLLGTLSLDHESVATPPAQFSGGDRRAHRMQRARKPWNRTICATPPLPSNKSDFHDFVEERIGTAQMPCATQVHTSVWCCLATGPWGNDWPQSRWASCIHR